MVHTIIIGFMGGSKKENIRDKLIEDLLKAGIETRPFFWPLHLQPSLPKLMQI